MQANITNNSGTSLKIICSILCKGLQPRPHWNNKKCTQSSIDSNITYLEDKVKVEYIIQDYINIYICFNNVAAE